MKALRIVIWDNDAPRIAQIDCNLYKAAQSLGIQIAVNSTAEPPALARERLLGRVPVLEIDGYYWSKEPHTLLTEEDCRSLLHKITSA